MTAQIEGFAINGRDTSARYRVVDVKSDTGWVLASYRLGQYGWCVSICTQPPSEIFVETQEDAEVVLGAVSRLLR